MQYLVAVSAILFMMVGARAEEPRIRIAISKASNTVVTNYINWLTAARNDVEVVELAGLPPAEAANALSDADGLLLSGGADVNPAAYMRNDLRPICEVDEERDAMEFALIKRARELNMPVLGICRGMQILNVAYGGTLIADIPTQHKTKTQHRSDRDRKIDAQHGVRFEASSYLFESVASATGSVNSAHHQCVETLAPFFKAAAYATDGIVEALEWNEESRPNKPFLFAVQWHPERLKYDNPMSLNIAKRFLREVELQKK